jgi:hypothetical protein
MVGSARAYELLRSLPLRAGLLAFAGAVVCLLAFINPSTGAFATANGYNIFLSWFPRESSAYYGEAGESARRWADDLNRAVPLHVMVSTVEAGMTPLYHARSLQLFPIDIDRADYAVIVRSTVAGAGGSYSGVVSFLGPEATAQVNAVMVERMKRDGYDFEHPVFVAPNGMTVLKRSVNASS